MSGCDVPNGTHEWPCIWVSAGILTYGLCDRAFDCDNCPLHNALSRSVERHATTLLDWPRDRRYSSNHLWSQAAADESVKVGITPFAAELLQPVSAWHFPVPGASLPAYSPIATVDTDAGPLPLLLPYGAQLLEVNTRIGVDKIWPLADPWESGYLATIRPHESRALHDACASLSSIGRELVRHKQLLVQAATEAGHYDTGRVRAADGGVPVSGWSRVLGRRQYKEVLGEVFGVSPI